jgi:hypothetical protein
MEWEQIADKWAAMTLRLRSDCMARPRSVPRSARSVADAKNPPRAPATAGAETIRQLTLETAGEPNPTSHR